MQAGRETGLLYALSILFCCGIEFSLCKTSALFFVPESLHNRVQTG